ncbi:cupin domain-containing protein [Chryseobacterium sp. D764]|jgi:oxalate decarboxylase/phosphoglucose isomerase-like protein (cupin superfamily)|uniref:cupin domain-containing protein n=1 Tax=unclassified Chryseobacterium TaxID=2593645 RepID=UPI00098631F5|nr:MULTISPECIES: cupin domain-containing protein [unclassified Chryseobacterium]QXU49193.1 cupin domain-containing protein [Chryseobacterium sp. D764]CAD0224671.1 Cupin_2 domain-containing protein [Chryseobacterium sp. JV274]
MSDTFILSEGAEFDHVIQEVSKYINLYVMAFEKNERAITQMDKRENMYGGKGTVYMLQMFDQKELANNRLAAYMVLLNKGDESGFHTHNQRNEQELYVVIHGTGEYRERTGLEGSIRKKVIKKGDITAISSIGYHSIENTGDGPLIMFVITTYNP